MDITLDKNSFKILCYLALNIAPQEQKRISQFIGINNTETRKALHILSELDFINSIGYRKSFHCLNISPEKIFITKIKDNKDLKILFPDKLSNILEIYSHKIFNYL